MGYLPASGNSIVGLLGHLLNNVHDLQLGHVRGPHELSDQLPLRPFEFFYELFPGPDIGSSGSGGVGLVCDIEVFHHFLDTFFLVNHQGSLFPVPNRTASTVLHDFPRKFCLEGLIELFRQCMHIRV